jgi:DUF1680 family protein
VVQSNNGKASELITFLPQRTDEGDCYAETCASIGVMMIAERLLQVIFHDRKDDGDKKAHTRANRFG